MHKASKLMALCFAGLFCVCAWAQLDSKPLIESVDVEEKLGDMIDLDLEFVDQNGKAVKLSDYINDQIPTIVAPVYYSCPQLCTLIINGVRDLIEEVKLNLGQDYQVLCVSFDPTNTPQLAKAKADNYISTLDKEYQEGATENWHFLTGKAENSAKLMDQIGFRYKKIDNDYSHTSVIVYLSPEGKITRYIYGVDFPPRDARLAVLEAAGGTVGSTIDKILIYCFRYDPLAGKYVPYAWRIMRIGSFLGLLALGTLCLFLWRGEFRKRRLEQNA